MPLKEFWKFFELVDLRLSPEQREDLLNFLKNLTDERVRFKKAPVDHPELIIRHGHLGNNDLISKSNQIKKILVADELLIIPAVGVEGRTEPLQAFDYYLK